MKPSTIGASVPQVTAREKLLGRAQYVGDFHFAPCVRDLPLQASQATAE